MVASGSVVMSYANLDNSRRKPYKVIIAKITVDSSGKFDSDGSAGIRSLPDPRDSSKTAQYNGKLDMVKCIPGTMDNNATVKVYDPAATSSQKTTIVSDTSVSNTAITTWGPVTDNTSKRSYAFNGPLIITIANGGTSKTLTLEFYFS